MKLQKVMTLGITGVMALSLAACGNKSATETHKSTAESSHVTKKHNDKKKSSLKIVKNSSKKSSTKKNSKSGSSANDNTVLGNSSSSNSTKTSSSNSSNGSAVAAASSSASSSSAKQSTTRTMSADDARNLVKEHLSNQRANALQAGKASPNQPSVDSIDNFTTQNSGNGWTVSGSYNGQTYTYHVTPNAVTGN